MKRNSAKDASNLKPKYDFRGGKRGKYARCFAEGTNLVAIDPDALACFPDAPSINQALRALIGLGSKLPKMSACSKAKK